MFLQERYELEDNLLCMFKGDETVFANGTATYDSNNYLSLTTNGNGRMNKYCQPTGDWVCEFEFNRTSGSDGGRLGVQSINKGTDWERAFAGTKNNERGMTTTYASSKSSSSIHDSTSFLTGNTTFRVIKITCISNTLTIYVDGVQKQSGTIDWADEPLTLGWEKWNANLTYTLKYFKIKAL